ncbi:glycosyltransferase family 4 protein [Hwangdonia lutea]|uniref:Glycosyltransferase family 4 protein n=1 Tax=Hwangdonia lutea TaxID=3075823 RepID=A0AA97HQI5_9FLAO|nr:glycosyltransferase family 4 protein [Hwangdonia sp. SCSIO 19198]WOD43981.1 glycosyltransferase family 4 protein [Hwangdonia sp. SCSIO 19198]
MSSKKINIALFSPSKNPYSETFIHAHKKYLNGNIFYYYGTGYGLRLEHEQNKMPFHKRFILKIYTKLTSKSSTYIWKQKLLYSLKTNRVDVVLVEYGTHAHSLRKILKESCLPIVVHFHGYDASINTIVEDCGKYKEVFQLSKKVIVVSKKMEEMLLELGCPQNKLVYNVYGPQPEFLEIESRFSKKQLIAIGRFTDKKAPYYTLLAFKGVVSKHPDALLLFAGDGVLYNSVSNLIRYYDLENNVKLLGIISPEEYRAILKDSRAFVQHSITAANGDMEGTPLAVLEASAAGLPVISTYHAGIPDVVEHKTTGLLSEEHDIETMSMHMLQVLDDLNFAKKLGKSGKLNIMENFSLDRHINNLQNILEKVV